MTDITLPHTSKQNQQIYQRLKIALGLELRRQIFVAVCDDLALQSQLAAHLDADLAYPELQVSKNRVAATPSLGQGHYPRLVTLNLDLSDPNPIGQLARWLHNNPPPLASGRRLPTPGFQILGVEQLTRQPASVQWQFLDYLRSTERDLTKIESSLLLWLPRPWFHSVQQSAPEFWNLHTGFFEFAGDPTPIVASHPLDLQLQVMEEPDGAALEPTLVDTQQLEPTKIDKPDIWDILTEDLAKLGESQSQPAVTVEARDPGETTQNALSHRLQKDTPATTNGKANGHSKTIGSSKASEYQGRDYQILKTSPATVKPAKFDSTPLHLEEGPVRQPQRAVLELGSLLARESHKPLNLVRKSSALPKPQLQAVTLPNPAAQQEQQPLISQTQIQEWRSLIREPQAQQILDRLIGLNMQPTSAGELATVCQTLGNFYRDRIEQGDSSPQNLNLAVQSYEQVLHCLEQVSQSSGLPLNSAAQPFLPDVLNDLGNLYWMFSRQLSEPTEKLPKLTRSIATYQAALSKLDPNAQPLSCAMVYNNLGAAYGDLARYQDTVENLQQSIQAYQVALQYRQPEMDPLKYASTQNNLGTAYWHLAQHQQPVVHLKAAITAYTEALQYYHPDQEPFNYAMIQNNVGTAYWNLAQYEQPDQLLELAIRAYQAALIYRTAEAVPAAHAATQNNLGTAYWHTAGRLKDNPAARQDYLVKAIASYTAAIQTATQVNTPLTFDVFATQNNLGLACYQIATDKQFPLERPQRSQYLEAALHHHLKALQGWQHQPEYYQTALGYVVQTIRGFYSELGLQGQNQALSKVPGNLLREILPKL